MAESRGKQFEQIIRETFSKVEGVSIDRLHDQTTGYKQSSTNICDFIVYKKPYEYYIECKTVHGNTLSIHSMPKPDKYGKLHGFYGNITDNQWEGMLEKSKIDGVFAGVICWWVDKDVTLFIPIQELEELFQHGNKSIRYDIARTNGIFEVCGEKKRIFFSYDMNVFFHRAEKQKGGMYDKR